MNPIKLQFHLESPNKIIPLHSPKEFGSILSISSISGLDVDRQSSLGGDSSFEEAGVSDTDYSNEFSSERSSNKGYCPRLSS